MEAHDVIILGGGPAGMTAALVAGRARLDAVIINEERPRNRVTKASHGFLTRDGIHPLDLLRIAKEQKQTYPSVTYRQGVAESVQRTPDGFEVRLQGGAIHAAKRLVVATGCRDDLDAADIPALHQVYGTSVFPCPFCDGFEHRDQALAVFGCEGMEMFAPLLKQWSSDVHLFTNGRTPTAEALSALQEAGIPVHAARIQGLEHQDGVLVAVETADGRVPREAGFIGDDLGVPATSFANDLGVGTKTNDWGMTVPDVDGSGGTHIPGLFVIGDARTGFSGLIAAAAEGEACMSRIVHDLAMERYA